VEVLSPYQFAIFPDELSIQLGSERVGCTLGNKTANYLIIVDDIRVFGPTVSGLQCLLNICDYYVADYDTNFNGNKTIGELFCPKK